MMQIESNLLRATLAVLWLASAAAASGQGAAVAGGTSADESPPPTRTLKEIVVTAERRAVSTQRAPYLISAETGGTLSSRNIDDPTDLQSTVPNVQILSVGAQPAAYIRGVGTAVADPRGDPDASFSIDGVAIARPLSVNGAFFDLSRVEILKGPQGTLYGRNSTVGAINLISNLPTFTFGGNAAIEYGNYSRDRLSAVINMPLSNDFAVRIAAQRLKHDGYLTSGADDADNSAVRISGLWKPDDKLSAVLRLSYFRDVGIGVGDVPLKSTTGSFLDPQNPWYVKAGTVNYIDTVGTDARQNLHDFMLSAEVDYKMPFATLAVIPGYVTTTYGALTYSGGFRQHYEDQDRQKSVEVRLTSPAGMRLQWLVGSLYLKDDQAGPEDTGVTPTFFARTEYGDLGLRSAALFTQETFGITDRFRLVGGLRYSYERKSLNGSLYDIALDLSPLPGPVTPIFGDATYQNVSYKAGFEFDVSKNSLLYANVATGYKAGGFNAGTPPNTYKPEKMTAYTLGWKNRLLHNRMTLNAEAWHWIYKDVNEVQFGLANPFPNVQLLTYNAAQIKSDGIELQADALLWQGAKIKTDLSYNRAKFSQFYLPPFVFGPFNIAASNLSGLAPPWAPQYSANLGLEQRVDLGGAGALLAAVNSQIKSAQRIQPAVGLGSVTGGTATVDASLTWLSPDDRWEFEGWVDNIGDVAVLYFAGTTPAGLWGHPGPPRTFGLTLRTRFGN